jgi:hypothetical protein
VEGAAEEIDLGVPLDAAALSLTHDVLQSPPAVVGVISHLRPGARVASFGAKTTPRSPVNVVVRAVSRRYVTTFDGLERPWELLARLVPDLRVKSVAFGGAYLAWGQTPAIASSEAETPQ